MKTDVKRNIFVIDDQPVVRAGVARIVGQQKDLAICGEAGDPGEALEQIKALKPDLVILDVATEGRVAVDLPQTVRQEFPNLPVLIFTTHQESLCAERMLRAGINGYVMKKESGDTLLKAIRRVLDRKIYLSPQLNERILKRLSGSDRDSDTAISEILSERESRVFELIGQGYNTRKISEELSMSMKTVETHRMHIKAKLKLKNTVELVQRAIRWVHHENAGFSG